MTSSSELLWDCGGLRVLLAGALDATGLREDLARRLLRGLPGAPRAFRLDHDSLGRPRVLGPLGEESGWAVSFSRHAGWLWAAAAQTTGLGIDATGPEDFPDTYPDARTFAPKELDAALGFSASLSAARALLWSLKEAGAKALGTGFHRVEPRDLAVRGLAPWGQGAASCRVETGLGELDARTCVLFGFRVAVAVRIPQARSENA